MREKRGLCKDASNNNLTARSYGRRKRSNSLGEGRNNKNRRATSVESRKNTKQKKA